MWIRSRWSVSAIFSLVTIRTRIANNDSPEGSRPVPYSTGHESKAKGPPYGLGLNGGLKRAWQGGRERRGAENSDAEP